MEAKRYGKMLAIALLGGILGGILSHSVTAAASGVAQTFRKDRKIVKAQEFLVVDSRGRVRARFGMKTISGVMSTSPRVYSINKEESDPKSEMPVVPDESSEEGFSPEEPFPHALPKIDPDAIISELPRPEFPRVVLYDQFGEVIWQAPRGVEFLFGAEFR